MAETETEPRKLEPKSEVEQAGPCKLKVRVEISAEKVNERIDGKYKELNDAVALPGFRKGHAPRNLLERKFGKAILDDLKGEILRDSFEEVREEHKLEPVGEPDMDVEELKVEHGKPFAYEMSMEVQPTVELKEYTGLKVKKPKVDISDEHVDRIMASLREAKAELVPAEDGAKEQDQVISDMAVVADGNEVEKQENTALFLNDDVSFFGMKLEDLYKAFLGKKPGDEVEYEVETPADFANKDLAGKKLKLKARIKSVKRKILPEVDEKFAKSFDMDTVEELREHLGKRARREAEQAALEQAKDELVRQIVDANEFPLPEKLVESSTEEALQRLRLQMTMGGLPPTEIEKTVEQSRTESKDSMVRSLRTHFVLEHVGKKEKIFVTEDEVEERITRLAQQHGRWPHEMRAYLDEQGLTTQLRRQMREEKIRDFLLEKAVVEEVEAGGEKKEKKGKKKEDRKEE